MERKLVTIYTDGACKGNPGPGGWAAIMVYAGIEKILQGGDRKTTNNRMELTAVLEAVKALKKPCQIQIVTDSSYVMMTNDKWIKWQAKQSLPNKDLWDELLTVAKSGHHKLGYIHVDGHTGHVYNERCDKLAKAEATRYSHILAESVKQPKRKSCMELIGELMLGERK